MFRLSRLGRLQMRVGESEDYSRNADEETLRLAISQLSTHFGLGGP